MKPLVVVPKHFTFSPALYRLHRKKRVEVQESSKQAYARIIESGLLVRNQLLCYECVRKIGPCTGTELWLHMKVRGLIPKHTRDPRAWAARPLSKLHEKKCMSKSKEPRPCTVNFTKEGDPVNETEWWVNERLPVMPRPDVLPPEEDLLQQALQQARRVYLIALDQDLQRKVPVETSVENYAPLGHLLRYLSYRIEHQKKGLPKT